MKYITPEDFYDNVLDVAVNDILEAEGYIENVALGKGVEVDKFLSPLPFKARRLAICFACYNCCLRKVGTDPTTTFDGGQRADIYAQKLELYKQELKAINETLSASDFTGVPSGGRSIRLERA